MAKTALITGVTGQDGAYLAKLLLEKAKVAVAPGLGFGPVEGDTKEGAAGAAVEAVIGVGGAHRTSC